ncbi:MAG TPA: efflux RND transporter periplasmic adaptor subunit [Thermodesulfobacteriota bacterium]
MKNKKLYLLIFPLLMVMLVIGVLIFKEKLAITETTTLKGSEDEKGVTNVEVTKVVRKDLVRKIGVPASIGPLHKATLYAKAAGYLNWINVDIGDQVKEGEVLAEMDIPEMVEEYQQVKAKLRGAQANYKKAEADFELQKQTYQRIKDIWATEPGAVAKQDVDVAKAKFELAKASINNEKAKIDNASADMERLKALLEYGKIKAPFDGVITERFVDPGALVQDATSNNVSPVVTIMHTDTVRVFIDVPEPDVPFVEKGDEANLVVDALPGRNLSASVTRFANALNPGTRTMRTEIDIPNPDQLLLPGMYGNITLNLDVIENAVTVPADAITVEKNNKYVYKVKNGKVEKVQIETGIDDGIRVQVVTGLKAGEEIIIKGNNTVSDGDTVKVTKRY